MIVEQQRYLDGFYNWDSLATNIRHAVTPVRRCTIISNSNGSAGTFFEIGTRNRSKYRKLYAE